MSQKELAEAACLTPASVSRYVNGEREPRALTVAALAEVLVVKPSDIIGTTDEQEMDTAVRYDVLRRDNFHCVRCGRGKEDGVKLHVDHIVPVSRGGKSVMGNLQTLCEDCNYGKGNRYEE